MVYQRTNADAHLALIKGLKTH